MEIRTIVSMTDIHEYAKQQLSLLEGTQHTALNLSMTTRMWNARVNGQIMAWQHVLRVEWTNPHNAEDDSCPVCDAYNAGDNDHTCTEFDREVAEDDNAE